MNVLFLSINVPANGKRDSITYNFITKEMDLLSKRGYNVYFLSESLKINSEIHKIKYISKNAILEQNTLIRRIKNFLFLIKYFELYWRFSFLDFKKTMGICGIERALDKIIKTYNINLIHTHFFYPEGENGMISAKKHKVPIIATLRGAELYNLPDLEYGAMLEKYYRQMVVQSIKYVDYFTAPNRHLTSRLMDIFDISSEKVEYVPNGVNTKISIQKIEREDSEVRFIAVGRLIKTKNFDLLLHALKFLNDSSLKLTIIGEGPLYSHLTNLILKNNIKDISIIDEMPKYKLFNVIASSDCLIHPSFVEGMPNVVLESLAIGIPCLVSNIPAHNELIKEGLNGFLFDPYSQKDLIKKMQFILRNRNILSHMKDYCINSVRRYSIEAKIDKYIEIYEKVFKNNKTF
jgi:glycosyltransferase involved in cell wall biosynthesis